MIVLAVGATPALDTESIRQMVSLSKSPSGFLKEAHAKLKPVDTPTKGVFIAGAAESPKDVRESVTQASAAASHASILLSKSALSVEAITSVIDEDLCKKCGLCVPVCPFNAIIWEKKQVAIVTSAACTGCGTCAAECKFEAITMRHFSDQAIYAQIDAMLEEDPQDTVVTFACNWCSYAGADTAGVSRMDYPPNARIIRTMCSGRVSPEHVWYAFRNGAPVVLVSGCHYVDCHYIDANRSTTRRLDGLWDGLEKNGLRPDQSRPAQPWLRPESPAHETPAPRMKGVMLLLFVCAAIMNGMFNMKWIQNVYARNVAQTASVGCGGSSWIQLCDRAVLVCRAQNPEVAGSSPGPATKSLGTANR